MKFIKHGKGKIVYEDGDVYDGVFVNDHFNGQGIYQWAKNAAQY